MPPFIAFWLFAAFILWLFSLEGTRPGKSSAALWIPLTWAFVIGTRPLSLLLGVGSPTVDINGTYIDSPLDKGLFVLLIAAGLYVVVSRRAKLRVIVAQNKWLVLYFLYLAISVLWADDSFISLKRWVKDFGHFVMALVVLSDVDPRAAAKRLLAWLCYLIVPLSVMVTKYFPTFSRHYDIWTNQPTFTGLATGKNALGMTLFVCGLSLCWMALDLYDEKIRSKQKVAGYSLLAVMTAWLLIICQSATALVCTIVGCLLLVGLRIKTVRSKVKRLGTYAAVLTIIIVALQSSLGLWDSFVGTVAEAVGRDPTMHGRHEIWRAVLAEDTNPLIGVGFYSFWSNERNARLSEQYFYMLGEAHNGFIETYLNSGLIGLLLLFAAIASAISSIKADVSTGSSFGALRLLLLLGGLLYNVTESIFDRLSIVWFIMLLAMIQYHRATALESQTVPKSTYERSIRRGKHRVGIRTLRPRTPARGAK
jgi:exopolysaccharide production protein ExoQ